MSVEYREIEGFPGYHVGDDGSVWGSRPRRGDPPGTWRRLATSSHRRCGHKRIYIRALGTRRWTCRWVHHLVLNAFVGPRPEGMECRHLDGNPANNSLSNLRWGTRSENAADKARHGRQSFLACERNPNSKLLPADVVRVLRLRSEGASQNAIACMVNISQSQVSRICRGKNWVRLTGGTLSAGG